MLPAVFIPEKRLHSDSEIWLTEDREFLPGHRYMIRAESGKGKSSLCAYLYGARTDYAGTMTVAGGKADSLSKNDWIKLRRESIAYLPQETGLFAPLTVMENILLKNRMTDCKTKPQIMAMLEAVGMGAFADRPAGKLSIGQQQRVGLVRTLCQPFSLLILDEPVSHLDDNANQAAARLVEQESERNNATVIVTSVGNDLKLPGCEILSL